MFLHLVWMCTIFFEDYPKKKHVFYDHMTVEVLQGTLYFERSSLFIISQKGTFCIFVVHCLLIRSISL